MVFMVVAIDLLDIISCSTIAAATMWCRSSITCSRLFGKAHRLRSQTLRQALHVSMLQLLLLRCERGLLQLLLMWLLEKRLRLRHRDLLLGVHTGVLLLLDDMLLIWLLELLWLLLLCSTITIAM